MPLKINTSLSGGSMSRGWVGTNHWPFCPGSTHGPLHQHTPYQGDNGHICWGQRQQAYKLKAALNFLQGGVGEGLEFTSSHENSKITTNCWTTTDQKDWNLSKKHTLHPDKEEATMRQLGVGVGERFHDIIKSHPLGGQATNWKNNYITKALPQEWEFRVPWQAPQPEGLALEGASRAFGFEGQWGPEQTINAGRCVEKKEPSYTVHGNVNWYNLYREQYGASLKNEKRNYHMIQQSPWAYIQRKL